MAAVTNDHKPGGFEQQKSVLAQFWSPEVEGQNQGVHRAVLLPKPLGEDLASSSFSWPQALLGLWLHHSYLCFRLPSVCISVSKFPLSYKDTSDTGFRAHLHPLGPHLNLTTSAKTLFPNTVTFTGSRGA